MTTTDTQIMLKVPQEVIEAQVRAAVAAALGRDPLAMARAVVDAAMNQKADGYGRGETVFVQWLNKAIRDVAQDAAKEWIEEQKPTIKAMVRERLGVVGKKTAAPLVDKLCDALSSQLDVSIRFKDRDY